MREYGALCQEVQGRQADVVKRRHLRLKIRKVSSVCLRQRVQYHIPVRHIFHAGYDMRIACIELDQRRIAGMDALSVFLRNVKLAQRVLVHLARLRERETGMTGFIIRGGIFAMTVRHELQFLPCGAANSLEGFPIEQTEIAMRIESRFLRKDANQRVGKVWQARKIESVERAGGICCGYLVGLPFHTGSQGQHILRHGQRSLRFPLDGDVAFLEGCGQVNAAQGKYQERIAINLAADEIDSRRKMLARHCPVGAGTVHIEVFPFLREYGDAKLFRLVEHHRIELAVEHSGDDHRRCGQCIQ